MENRFTLRLGKEEYQSLQKIKQISGEVTNAGAIRYVIRTFCEQTERYAKEIDKNTRLNRRCQRQKEIVANFMDALEQLKESVNMGE